MNFVFEIIRLYMEYVKERADYHTRILPHDNRNRAEKERANQIWKHLRPRGNTKGFFFVDFLSFFVLSNLIFHDSIR